MWHPKKKLMNIKNLENLQIGSPAASSALSVSEMSPALPTASSKVTPSDSHPPTIDRGPSTEMISDSSSASVPSSSTRLLASPLLITASRTMGDQGELIIKGRNNIRGCTGTLHMMTTLASRNNSTLILFLLLINHDEWHGLLSTSTWWIYNFIH